MALAGRVSPFGDPRIKACSRLPAAYRSVPRPSSPLDAKASTKRPSLLEIRTPKQPAGRTMRSAGGKGAPRRRQPCAAALGRAAPHCLRNQETHHARQRTTCPNQCLLTISETALPARAGQANRRRRARACLLETWWSRTGSNRRPPACKAGALPTELRPLPGRRPPPRGGGANAAIRNLRRVSAAEARTTVKAGERGTSGGPG